MGWTQTDIDRLRKAISTGARRVEFGDGQTRSVQEFHSLDAMLGLLAQMEAGVAGALAPQRTALTEFTRD